MRSFSTRTRSSVVVLVTLAAGACSDQPAATEARSGLRPRLAVGDVVVVTNTTDNDAGSLRLALRQTTGGEVIRFDASLAGATITLDSTLVAPNVVTIEGASDKGLTIKGSGNGSVLRVVKGATLVNLTITGGGGNNANGGGINAEGAELLVLDHTTVTGNQGIDGGIRATTVTLTNSTVTLNTSTGSDVSASGIAYSLSGGLTLINSTVANNIGHSGLSVFGNSEFTPKVLLRNSIISGNGVQNCIFTQGYSYEGRNISDDKFCGDETKLVIADPLLGELADNGGPTRTLALDRNSPAINRGLNCSVTVDQRNVARDAKCDIGAFEFVFTTVALTVSSSAQVDPKTGSALVSGTLKCSRGETFDLAVGVKQDQKTHRTPTLVQATKTIPVTCETTPQPWVALVAAPSGQAFQNGAALASAETVNIAAGVIPATTTKDVQLAWTKKN